jgi:hypothetical protein
MIGCQRPSTDSPWTLILAKVACAAYLLKAYCPIREARNSALIGVTRLLLKATITTAALVVPIELVDKPFRSFDRSRPPRAAGCSARIIRLIKRTGIYAHGKTSALLERKVESARYL